MTEIIEFPLREKLREGFDRIPEGDAFSVTAIILTRFVVDSLIVSYR